MGSFPRRLGSRIGHCEANTAAVGGSMAGTPPNDCDPKVIFKLEAETGEVFEISFSLRGILSTVVMAHSWTPLKEELAQLEPPTKV